MLSACWVCPNVVQMITKCCPNACPNAIQMLPKVSWGAQSTCCPKAPQVYGFGQPREDFQLNVIKICRKEMICHLEGICVAFGKHLGSSWVLFGYVAGCLVVWAPLGQLGCLFTPWAPFGPHHIYPRCHNTVDSQGEGWDGLALKSWMRHLDMIVVLTLSAVTTCTN